MHFITYRSEDCSYPSFIENAGATLVGWYGNSDVILWEFAIEYLNNQLLEVAKKDNAATVANANGDNL